MRKKACTVLTAVMLFVCFAFGMAVPAEAKTDKNVTTMLMSAGQSLTPKLKNAKKVTWKSSDKKIASVSKKGKIKAKKAGTATVTAKIKNRSYKYNVTVSSGKNKTLVVYFSATGTTKKAAVKVSNAAGADIIRLMPEKAYTSADLNYNNDNSRANKEQNANKYVATATQIKNLSQYDTVYLGYPIWHGKEPGVIRTFLKNNNLKGKTVIPFCTSGGSGISGSMEHIRKLAKGADVKDGKDLTQSSNNDVVKWVSSFDETEPVEQSEQTEHEEPAKKTLVIYFSRTGNTKAIAQKIMNIENADGYEITALEPYSDDDINYVNSASRATMEQNDLTARPKIGSATISLEAYDRIYLGYPIWWGQAPRIMDTFVETYDFSGKTVIPFCTSGSSNIGSSAERLSSLAKSGNWLTGTRFGAGASESDVKAWIDGLK